MPQISNIIILCAILGIMLCLVILGIWKSSSGIKLMLLGLNLTLFGGIFAIDPSSNLGGIEYIITFLGLMISITGLWKKG